MGKKGLKLATQKLQDLSKKTMMDALNKVTSKDKPKQSNLKKGMEKNKERDAQIKEAQRKKEIEKWNDVRTTEVYRRHRRLVNKDKKSDKELYAEKKLYELGAGTAYKPKEEQDKLKKEQDKLKKEQDKPKD